MRYDDRERGRRGGHDPHRPRRAAGGGDGGVPDGLLVGALAFLLGLTVFVWTATGLAGLFSHGAWPDDVTFGRTPLAIRGLVTEPHDIAGAWPGTPPGQLSGYGLFWGIFVSQLMVLMVLTVFVMGTVARARAVRKARRLVREREEAETFHTKGSVPVSPDPAQQAPGSQQTPPSPPPQPHAPQAHPAPPQAEQQAPHAAQAPHDVPAQQSQPRPTEAASPTASSPTALPTPPGTQGAPPSSPADGPAVPLPTANQTGPGPGPTAPAPLSSEAGTAGLSGGLSGAPAGGRRTTADGAGAPGPDGDPVGRVLEAPGAVLVTSATPDLWAATKAARAKLGPVHLFDPTHACDTPDRIRWSPHHGCADRTTVASRATALLAPLRSPRPIDATTHSTAETMLRCWLHAAALEKRPFREVHRWALATGGTADAVRILRSHPKATAGAAGELEAALAGHPQLRADAVALIRRALAPLSQLHVRNACSAERADRLAMESFIAEAGTLYVVGAEPEVLPLLHALIESVVEHGRRMAARSSDGRLDPPLTTVLELAVTPSS
ncbi:hypothetical protein [Streptomyces reniochalinae]|uniref:Type VI secretion protein n=1 Tax=Streptomyces reniochalinae TaxID=2250578 RepID=A0A367EJD9_9ACTN|nr:hypothetical protein [Streptomyces reniochalinae]RCG18171.1 hypothetical protein DQ392_16110 [Streptomyces reniochalinae]